VLVDVFAQSPFCRAFRRPRVEQHDCLAIHCPQPFPLRHIVFCLGPVRFGDRRNDGMRKCAAFGARFLGHLGESSMEFRIITRGSYYPCRSAGGTSLRADWRRRTKRFNGNRLNFRPFWRSWFLLFLFLKVGQ
jgi:hypothetical protein